MDKKINLLARSYEDYKSELIKFSKMYYPELSDNYNDASVGRLVSAYCGRTGGALQEGLSMDEDCSACYS